MHQVAATISNVVGEEVQSVEIPVSAWLEYLQPLPQMNEHFLAHLEQLAPEVARGAFAGPTDVVRRVDLRPRKSFAAFVEEHRSAFGADA